MSHKIEEVFVFVATDSHGDEAIPAIQLGNIMMPLVCTDRVILAKVKQAAQEVATGHKKNIYLLHFQAPRVVEKILPDLTVK